MKVNSLLGNRMGGFSPEGYADHSSQRLPSISQVLPQRETEPRRFTALPLTSRLHQDIISQVFHKFVTPQGELDAKILSVAIALQNGGFTFSAPTLSQFYERCFYLPTEEVDIVKALKSLNLQVAPVEVGTVTAGAGEKALRPTWNAKKDLSLLSAVEAQGIVSIDTFDSEDFWNRVLDQIRSSKEPFSPSSHECKERYKKCLMPNIYTGIPEGSDARVLLEICVAYEKMETLDFSFIRDLIYEIKGKTFRASTIEALYEANQKARPVADESFKATLDMGTLQSINVQICELIKLLVFENDTESELYESLSRKRKLEPPKPLKPSFMWNDQYDSWLKQAYEKMRERTSAPKDDWKSVADYIQILSQSKIFPTSDQCKRRYESHLAPGQLMKIHEFDIEPLCQLASFYKRERGIAWKQMSQDIFTVKHKTYSYATLNRVLRKLQIPQQGSVSSDQRDSLIRSLKIEMPFEGALEEHSLVGDESLSDCNGDIDEDLFESTFGLPVEQSYKRSKPSGFVWTPEKDQWLLQALQRADVRKANSINWIMIAQILSDKEPGASSPTNRECSNRYISYLARGEYTEVLPADYDPMLRLLCLYRVESHEDMRASFGNIREAIYQKKRKTYSVGAIEEFYNTHQYQVTSSISSSSNLERDKSKCIDNLCFGLDNPAILQREAPLLSEPLTLFQKDMKSLSDDWIVESVAETPLNPSGRINWVQVKELYDQKDRGYPLSKKQMSERYRNYLRPGMLSSIEDHDADLLMKIFKIGGLERGQLSLSALRDQIYDQRNKSYAENTLKNLSRSSKYKNFSTETQAKSTDYPQTIIGIIRELDFYQTLH